MYSGSPFDNQPPIFIADFAIVVLFAIFSFQLAFVFLLTGIKTRKSWGGAFGTVTEQEVELQRFHRPRYAILMALSLISPIVMYSMQAASTFYGFINILTYYSIMTTYAAFWGLQNVFFSAVLIAVLDSGIKASQLHYYSTMENGIQGGTSVNIIVMSCLVAVLMILTIARIVVIDQLYGEYLAFKPSAITMQKWWVQFGLTQACIFISVVLAIYYIVVAILMWRKKRVVPYEPNEVDKTYSFRVLDRIVILVCPLLLLSTLYAIISVPIANTIFSPTAIITSDTSLSFYFANDFISGVFIIMLNVAVMGVGNVL